MEDNNVPVKVETPPPIETVKTKTKLKKTKKTSVNQVKPKKKF
jgi:hypothetical protein